MRAPCLMCFDLISCRCADFAAKPLWTNPVYIELEQDVDANAPHYAPGVSAYFYRRNQQEKSK